MSVCVCHDCSQPADAGYHLSAWWCSLCLQKRTGTSSSPPSPDTFLTVDKLMAIQEDFWKKFPRIDQTKDTAIFANWFHLQYGFKIIPKCLPDDCIAVSPNVYALLMGVKV